MNNESRDNTADFDAIIVGAGLCGIYMLYKLLQQGLRVMVVDRADEPGGTWYWNRYPGARFDSESYTYGYSFSDALLQEWDWSEHFAAQPETLRYLNHVVEHFDLREHMQFGLSVERADYNEADSLWAVTLDDGRSLSCRYLLTAVGMLSAATLPNISGGEEFHGKSFHTYYWPKEPVDLKGKRVGMGQPGGVSMLDADAMMGQLGLTPDKDFKAFRVRLGNMANMLSDGNLDAALWNGSFPLPPVIKLGAKHKVKLLPISDAFYGALSKKYPPYARLSIPAGTYKGIDKATPTYGLGNALVISAKVPEALVYNMTKAIMTNLDRLKGVHPAFGRVNKSTVLNGFGAPLHPGALRYYREAGVPGIEEFVKRTSSN